MVLGEGQLAPSPCRGQPAPSPPARGLEKFSQWGPGRSCGRLIVLLYVGRSRWLLSHFEFILNVTVGRIELSSSPNNSLLES